MKLPYRGFWLGIFKLRHIEILYYKKNPVSISFFILIEVFSCSFLRCFHFSVFSRIFIGVRSSRSFRSIHNSLHTNTILSMVRRIPSDKSLAKKRMGSSLSRNDKSSSPILDLFEEIPVTEQKSRNPQNGAGNLFLIIASICILL